VSFRLTAYDFKLSHKQSINHSDRTVQKQSQVTYTKTKLMHHRWKMCCKKSQLVGLSWRVLLFDYQVSTLCLSYHEQVRYLWLGPTVFCGKFCQIPQATLQNSVAHQGKIVNSAAYRGLPFVRKLSSFLLKNFTFWRLAWCSVMLATYKENYQSFFLSKSAICQLVALCFFTAVPYYHGNY